jgi:2-(1,2-epoxy-1,2-dihydrophenyl)acetyl-CoA isomerase
MTDRLVRHSFEEGVATITLARPEAGNAMSMALMDDLYEAVGVATGDPRTRAILLRGEGRNFCVGGDIRSFGSDDDAGTFMYRLAGRLHETVRLLAAHPAPVVTAAQGASAGAGLSLVAGADVAIAARSATFTMAYAGIGLTADGGASWLLPRVIGLRRTQELTFTGRRLNAEEAERYGLVTRMVEDDALADVAWGLAARIAHGPTLAFGGVKALLSAQGGATFPQQLDAELEAIAAARTTDDAREGVAAFLARRPPNFTGH